MHAVLYYPLGQSGILRENKQTNRHSLHCIPATISPSLKLKGGAIENGARWHTENEDLH